MIKFAKAWGVSKVIKDMIVGRVSEQGPGTRDPRPRLASGGSDQNGETWSVAFTGIEDRQP